MDSREAIISAAARLFAERGFYGASIAAIAADVGVTKQALLHHFGRKEALYAEVLSRISNAFLAAVIAAGRSGETPAARLEAFFDAMLARAMREDDEARLLMRELLDNRGRADAAQSWFLKPFLTALVEMLRDAHPDWRRASEGEAFAAIYQLLGAVTYFAVSAPTLRAILGETAFAETCAAYPARLAAQTRATIASAP